MSRRGITHHFFICTNQRPEEHPLPSCGRRGSATVFAAFQQELTKRGFPPGVKITATGCLTPCQHGPTVCVYPENIWYGGIKPEDVPEIVAAHLDSGTGVPRLYLAPAARLW